MRLTLWPNVVATILFVAGSSLGQETRIDPFSQSERGERTLDTNLIAAAQYVDTDITSIFRMISDLTGWSIILSPELSNAPPKITIWIKNLTARQVLEEITHIGGLVSEQKGNSVHVMTFDEYARIYAVNKEVLQLKHADATEVAALLQPFVDENQAHIVAHATGNKIVLLMHDGLMQSLKQAVEAIDVPFEKDAVKLIRLKHLEAAEIAPIIEDCLTHEVVGTGKSLPKSVLAETQLKEVETQRAGEKWVVRFMVEPKLNLVIIRGSQADVSRAAQLLTEMDVSGNISVVSYQLEYTNASEMNATLQTFIHRGVRGGEHGSRSPRLRVSASEHNNRIIVEGSAEDHERISNLLGSIDRPLPAGTGGVRVYRLENATSSEVAAVIAAMIEAEGIGSRRQFRDGLETDPPYIQRATPPSGGRRTMPGGDTSPTPVGDRSEGGETGGGDIMRAIVTEASEINAVIIRASAREHEEFANVIKELDQPRDQVLLELILVSLQSTENFDLGVELAGARVGDVSTNVIGFSRFGIGAVDSGKGSISLPVLAPFGANCAIFNSGDFSLVINALKTVGDIRVTSAPKILVQDNSAAEIRQLNQEPFESSSQGAETTQTAFGGFVEAGTRLTVIPHVSKDAWLRLEYEVQLSSFGNRTAEQEAANLPPPRRESNSRGVVRVPAEHVVVLGGLTATRDDSTTDSVPFLGDVPIFGELFKDRSSSTIEETLFIFIRPVVLRDRGFQDLLFISEGDIERAQIKPDEPMNPLKLFGPEPETDQQP